MRPREQVAVADGVGRGPEVKRAAVEDPVERARERPAVGGDGRDHQQAHPGQALGEVLRTDPALGRGRCCAGAIRRCRRCGRATPGARAGRRASHASPGGPYCRDGERPGRPDDRCWSRPTRSRERSPPPRSPTRSRRPGGRRRARSTCARSPTAARARSTRCCARSAASRRTAPASDPLGRPSRARSGSVGPRGRCRDRRDGGGERPRPRRAGRARSVRRQHVRTGELILAAVEAGAGVVYWASAEARPPTAAQARSGRSGTPAGSRRPAHRALRRAHAVRGRRPGVRSAEGRRPGRVGG